MFSSAFLAAKDVLQSRPYTICMPRAIGWVQGAASDRAVPVVTQTMYVVLLSRLPHDVLPVDFCGAASTSAILSAGMCKFACRIARHVWKKVSVCSLQCLNVGCTVAATFGLKTSDELSTHGDVSMCMVSTICSYTSVCGEYAAVTTSSEWFTA